MKKVKKMTSIRVNRKEWEQFCETRKNASQEIRDYITTVLLLDKVQLLRSVKEFE